jgi:hypothetical protein
VKVEEERKAMEAIRVINRKEREQRMELGKMVEDESEEDVRDLVSPRVSGWVRGWRRYEVFAMAEAADPATLDLRTRARMRAGTCTRMRMRVRARTETKMRRSSTKLNEVARR